MLLTSEFNMSPKDCDMSIVRVLLVKSPIMDVIDLDDLLRSVNHCNQFVRRLHSNQSMLSLFCDKSGQRSQIASPQAELDKPSLSLSCDL